MSSTKTATPVPKRVLVGKILDVIPEERIQAHFNIAPTTGLERRLRDFTKADLLTLMTSIPEGSQALADLERKYPLSSAPTLYLVKVHCRPETGSLLARTDELAGEGRSNAVSFGKNRVVRAVYMGQPAHTLDFAQSIAEVPLLYELRVEYTVSEPDSEDYGERKTVYSLEHGFIWIMDLYSHAVICCSDFAAVRPMLRFGTQRIGLRWALPDLTEEMLNRLAADGDPRTATFCTPTEDLAQLLDVRSLTMSDPRLGECEGFGQICQDPSREQTAGFYLNHPDLVFWGTGHRPSLWTDTDSCPSQPQ